MRHSEAEDAGGRLPVKDYNEAAAHLILFLERKSIKKNFSTFVKVFWPKGFRSVTELRFYSGISISFPGK